MFCPRNLKYVNVKRCLIWAYFSPDSDEPIFFSGKNNKMDRGLVLVAENNKVKHFRIDRLESCGLPVDYCDVFIICLDSHSDGTHSLLTIHWWASNDISLNLFWWRNKLIYILDALRVSTLGELFLKHQYVSTSLVLWCRFVAIS